MKTTGRQSKFNVLDNLRAMAVADGNAIELDHIGSICRLPGQAVILA
jgi:hypothetical protein